MIACQRRMNRNEIRNSVNTSKAPGWALTCIVVFYYLFVCTMCRAMSILHCECACTRYCHTKFLWQAAAAAVAGIAYILVGLLSHFLRTSTVFYVLFLRLFLRALCALHELYCSFCSDFERLL